MRRCPFCERPMELVSDGGLAVDTYECPVCWCRWCHGLSRLPNPDRLRDVAGELQTIADEIEAGDGLAGRLKGALS